MAALRDRAAVVVAPWMTEPRLSFIVPVLNEAQLLPSFLEQLQPWRDIAEIIVVDGGSEDGTDRLAEIIVVDGGSEDGSHRRAGSLCDRFIVSAPGRARQMNAGAQQSTGAYLFFLHCDTQLGITPLALERALQDHPAWGYFRVRLSGGDWRLRIIEVAMNLRSRTSHTGRRQPVDGDVPEPGER